MKRALILICGLALVTSGCSRKNKQPASLAAIAKGNAIVESSGGKVFRNNNVLGWGSCNRRFRSVRAGIHLVASRLATSTLYRDKGLDDVLATYNPDPEYVSRVKSVMRRLSSAATRSETRLN